MILKLCATLCGFLIISHSIASQADTINRYDGNGKKTGFWVFYGADRPDLNYCSECKIEEGFYQNGRKHGKWTKYFPDGITPRVIARYKDNRPSGSFQTFYEDGKRKEVGNYRAKMYYGDYKQWYRSGCIQQTKFFNDEGRLHSDVVYYYDQCEPNENLGQIEYKFKCSNGIPIDSAYRYYQNGDFKQYIVYTVKGNVASKVDFDRVNEPFMKESTTE